MQPDQQDRTTVAAIAAAEKWSTEKLGELGVRYILTQPLDVQDGFVAFLHDIAREEMPVDDCVHCRTTTVMVPGKFGMSDLVHVGGDAKCPEGTPGSWPRAQRQSRCPKCKLAVPYTYWEDPWANNWACKKDLGGCGYSFRYSLGD